MNEIIYVHVINFPDGTTYWIEDDSANELQERVDKWWNDNPQYKGIGVDLIIGSLRMLREDYNNISADINAI